MVDGWGTNAGGIYGQTGDLVRQVGGLLAGQPAELTLNVNYLAGTPCKVEVRDPSNPNGPSLLGSVGVTGAGAVLVAFTPPTTAVEVRIVVKASFRNASTTLLQVSDGIIRQRYGTTTKTMLVRVSSRERDRYEFGYNGQMKTNEIAGVGNHNTALFWEYDTRAARRWNIDPVVVPGRSGFSVFGSNPISSADPNGDREFGTYNEYKKALGSRAIAQKDWKGQDGHWLSDDRSAADGKYVPNSGLGGSGGASDVSKERFGNAAAYNLAHNASGEYQNISERISFYSWFQKHATSLGHEVKWPGAAAQVASGIEMLTWGTAKFFGYSNDEAADFANKGNKMIFTDAFPKMAALTRQSALKGSAAYNWDAMTLAQEQDLIQPLYTNITVTTLWLMESNAKQESWLARRMAPVSPFQGRLIKVTDRWVYGMTNMGYNVNGASKPYPGDQYNTVYECPTYTNPQYEKLKQ